MAKKKEAYGKLEVPCKFGKVGLGDEVASITCTFPRESLTLSTADKSLCNKRLVGRLLVVAGESNGQAHIEDTDIKHEVAGSFDVHGVSFTRKTISAGISFNIADIDGDDLKKLAYRTGRIVVDTILALPDKAEKKPKDAAGQKNMLEDQWREAPISQITDNPKTVAALVEAELTTMGALFDLCDPENLRERLVSLAGIGPRLATGLAKASEEWFAKNVPDASDDDEDDDDQDDDE